MKLENVGMSEVGAYSDTLDIAILIVNKNENSIKITFSWDESLVRLNVPRKRRI
jgi:hypothetical protein